MPGQKYTAKITVATTGGGNVNRYGFIVNGKNPAKVEAVSSNSKAIYYDFVLSDDIVYFTDDSANTPGGTMTVDIEKTAEQSDDLMEALFNDEITYQWYKNGTAISGEKGISRFFTEADIGNVYQVKVIYGSEYLISAPIDVSVQGGSLSISGVVKSKGSDSDTVKVELLQSGKTVKTAILSGNSERFVFNGLEKGTYTLRVVKSGHRQYSATITLTDRNVTHDVTLQELGDILLGDVNLDGQVNSIDSNLLKRSVAGEYIIESGSPAALNADINGDGQINSIDSNLLKRKVAGQ